MIQRHTQLMPTLRHGNRIPVFVEYRLVMTVGIEIEVVDGVLLALVPLASPAT
jgi:hypothetical protein